MKSNSRLIAQHVVWRIVYFGSLFFINLLIARSFAAEKSGAFFYLINNLAFILLIVSISLESGSAFFVASGKIEAVTMANFCAGWTAFASLAGFAIWWATLYLSDSPLVIYPHFIFAGLLYISGVLLTTYFTSLFYAKKEFVLPNQILISVNILTMFIIILARANLFIRHYFLTIFLFSFFLQGLSLLIFFLIRYRNSFAMRFPSKPILHEILKYSGSALVANVIYFLVMRVDYWFVSYYCSAGDLGNYIQASKLSQMLLVVPSVLGASLFPIFSAQKQSASTEQLAIVMRILFSVNLLLCIFIAAAGWFIIPFLFGSSFSQVYALLLLLVPGILSTTLNYPMTTWFSAAKRIHVNVYGSLVALIIIVIGDLIFIPRFGVMTASVISSLGYFSYFLYSVLIYRKEFQIAVKDFFLIRKHDLKKILLSLSYRLEETEVALTPNTSQ